MKLSQNLITRAMQLRPGDGGPRIVLDRLGIHHMRPPARDFAAAVTHHAEQKNVSAAESLYMVERLQELGAVDGQTAVRGQGAVLQAFSGKGDRQGCHTMPCQLVLDNTFPHQLTDGNGRFFNTNYLHRSIQLFARCTWSPKMVNAIDQTLEWSPESDFVKMYVDSVKAVLAGEGAYDAYREFAWRKESVLSNLLEQVHDEPLTTYDAMFLMGALTSPQGSQDAIAGRELDRLLADKQFLANLQQDRETVIEVYAERDQIVPHNVLTGDLKHEVQSETWTDPKQSK